MGWYRDPRVRWCVALVLTGLGAGVVGIGVTLLLRAVQHAAFGHGGATFLAEVQHASALRRFVALTVGGMVAGCGWWWLRSRARLWVVPDSLLQIVVVGLGASLGREGAPRRLAAAFAARCGHWLRLDERQLRLIAACGAGAGLAAVYHVPVGGLLFAAEAILGTLTWRVLLPAAVASGIAAAITGLTFSDSPFYRLSSGHLTGWLVLFAVAAGPVLAVIGRGFAAAMTWARASAPSSWRILPATTLTFAALGAVSIGCPQLLGNGRGPTDLALGAQLGLGLAALLMVLKPLATEACLRSGAAGGLLTPALATGALIGNTAGHIWPGGQAAACTVIAAAGLLAVTQRAPLCALAITLELVSDSWHVAVPTAIAVGGTVVALRVWSRLDGRDTTPQPPSRPDLQAAGGIAS